MVIASLVSALVAVSAQTAAVPPASELSLEQRTAIRCSSLFAIVARQQEAGDAEALEYPPMMPRGREFFVRTMAKMMEDPTFDRERVRGLLADEAQSLASDREAQAAAMPPCLALLDLAEL